MIGIIAIVLVLGGLIFFHELGHFLAARSLGIGVKTFSVGFGKALVSWQGKKTTYQISIFPLGGYVSMVGESDPKDIPEPFTAKESFALRPPLHRLWVVSAGPLFNMILAVFLYWVLIVSGQSLVLPKVADVVPDSPAAAAGLQPGDIVREMDGTVIRTWEDIQLKVFAAKDSPIDIVIERQGHEQGMRLTPHGEALQTRDGKTVTRYSIGVIGSQETYSAGPLAAIPMAFQETGHKVKMIGLALGDLFSGKLSVKESLGGPIILGKAVYNQAEYAGFFAVVSLCAFLSINLGLLNLLPIPALDGGHVLFCLIELVIHRPVPVKVQAVSTYLGFSLLICLMLMATVLDITRLVG